MRLLLHKQDDLLLNCRILVGCEHPASTTSFNNAYSAL